MAESKDSTFSFLHVECVLSERRRPVAINSHPSHQETNLIGNYG